MAMRDMARQMAAEGLTGMGGGMAPMMPTDPSQEVPEMPTEEEAAGSPMESLEEGLSLIEQALAGLAPDKAEQARKHVEALRGLVTDGEAVKEPAGEDAAGLEQALAEAAGAEPGVKEEV